MYEYVFDDSYKYRWNVRLLHMSVTERRFVHFSFTFARIATFFLLLLFFFFALRAPISSSLHVILVSPISFYFFLGHFLFIRWRVNLNVAYTRMDMYYACNSLSVGSCVFNLKRIENRFGLILVSDWLAVHSICSPPPRFSHFYAQVLRKSWRNRLYV